MAASRLKIAADGRIDPGAQLLAELGWPTGSTLEARVEGGELRLRRLEVDPFAEAMKAPDPAELDRLLERERQGREAAARRFEERLRQEGDVEIRPEDRPDYWR